MPRLCSEHGVQDLDDGTTHEHTSHAARLGADTDALAKDGTITHARTLLHAHLHANTSTYTDATVRRRTHALRVTQRQPNERVDASDTDHTVGVSVSVGHARTRRRLPTNRGRRDDADEGHMKQNKQERDGRKTGNR